MNKYNNSPELPLDTCRGQQFSDWLAVHRSHTWGCALSCFLWLPLGYYNSHFEGLDLENCHGRHEYMWYLLVPSIAKRAMAALKGIPSGSWQPWKESFQGWFIMMNHHDSSWITMIHHDESSWFMMMNHRDSSWWIFMMHHHDASSWCIIMSHDDESAWFMNDELSLCTIAMYHDAPWWFITMNHGVPWWEVIIMHRDGA